jgi:hypothetical protein
MNTASMLLPSAFACDSSSQSSTPKTRYQSRMRFASPPLSPPPPSTTGNPPSLNNLFTTCRALQSYLQPSPIPSQLPSPPITHAEVPALASSPFKLRLRTRTRENEGLQAMTPRKRIAKRIPMQVPRGMNKRRRDDGDEMSRSMFEQQENTTPIPSDSEDEALELRPSTPKRQRIAPESLPLGLNRSDFHNLHLQSLPPIPISSFNPELSVLESVEHNEEWSTEEDRMLVELVLEKLKLSKSEWQDCARSLGKDRGSVGKRWKSLMGAGDVGLKRGGRRARIHGTWR